MCIRDRHEHVLWVPLSMEESPWFCSLQTKVSVINQPGNNFVVTFTVHLTCNKKANELEFSSSGLKTCISFMPSKLTTVLLTVCTRQEAVPRPELISCPVFPAFNTPWFHTCLPQNYVFRNKSYQNPEQSIIFRNTSANVSKCLK